MTNPWEKKKCETCGELAYAQGDLCAECYEVESRLDTYLDSYNGLLKIISAIQSKGLGQQAIGPILVDSIVRGINGA